MAKTIVASHSPDERILRTHRKICPFCSCGLPSSFYGRRKVRTLEGEQHLRVQVRRCLNPGCPHYRHGYRAEEEGRIALPAHGFGLDVIALVGALRYQQHRTVTEIHQDLRSRGLNLCERTVSNLLNRYDELLALRLGDSQRLHRIFARQKRVILAIDGLQPHVGHEVLWVLRDCLSGEVLLARSLLSSTEKDLSDLIEQVKRDLLVPIVGVVSDGQHSIRNAVAASLQGVPHQLCQFHYLREAVLPIYESDRHAKKELKKRMRGIRPIEREVEERDDPQSQAILGYCLAVRSSLTDDGKPPLEASGLKLRQRLLSISASLTRVEKKGDCPGN